MKAPIKLIFISLLTTIVSFYSCSEIGKESHIPSLLDTALQQAKNNRPELEKVLSYYRLHPADSIKVNAWSSILLSIHCCVKLAVPILLLER